MSTRRERCKEASRRHCALQLGLCVKCASIFRTPVNADQDSSNSNFQICRRRCTLRSTWASAIFAKLFVPVADLANGRAWRWKLQIYSAIRQRLLPALTGQPSPKDDLRKLLLLPARLGGIGVIDPTDLPEKQFHGSREMCSPLVKLITDQGGDVLAALSEQVGIKQKLEKKRAAYLQVEALLKTSTLPPSLQRCATAAQEKGTSAWLTAVPLGDTALPCIKESFVMPSHSDMVGLYYVSPRSAFATLPSPPTMP